MLPLIKVKRLRSGAKIPTKGTAGAAGFDLYFAPADWKPICIAGYSKAKLGTGIAMAIGHGYFGAIYPRSGLSYKEGLRLTNCVGVVDEDYRGEIIVPIFNDSGVARVIKPGDRIAQLIFEPYEAPELKESEELDETTRGAGGFGSTGGN